MITEVLGGLGSWTVKLSEECPDEVLGQLGFLGHVVIVRGRVDVDATSASLLAAARYVGVLRDRSKDRRTLEGDGLLFWLGDEDDKADSPLLETAVTLSGASLSTAVNAVLPEAVHAGTINSAAGTYTGKHQYETPRAALDTITQAFNVEYRVNGDATLDVGTQAQLYRTSPVTIIAAKNTGADLDLTSLGAAFDVEESIRDYSGRIVLLGSSFDDGTTTTFATGSADAPTLPYLDPHGNTFRPTRTISESGTTTGSVTQRAQLQLNRFNRQATALKVTATDYSIEGNSFRVGDNAYVYDPANGIMDASRTVDFRGEVIHPDIVRISGATWPVSDEHTVAFRTNAGAWVDLTPWVVWEAGGGEITVGDLPKSLTSAGGNPVQDRADSLPDATIPTAPTDLSLSTFAVNDPRGGLSAIIRASWTAPTVNTDGTVITDLTSYFVRWRVLGRPAWQGSYVGVTQYDIPVLIDTDYEVQVAAADRSGHVSAYTASVTIHASVDTVPPPPPSDPAVTSYLGQLRIAWDGLDNTGAAMPNDFNRVDVHVSATTGFTPDATTLVSSLATAGVAYATAPYGVTRYVKLVAYDNARNASTPSGEASGATTQVVGTDIAGNVIDLSKITFKDQGNLIEDGSFNIADLSAARIAQANSGTGAPWSLISGEESGSQAVRRTFGAGDGMTLATGVPIVGGEQIMTRLRAQSSSGTTATARLWVQATWYLRDGTSSTQLVSSSLIPSGSTLTWSTVGPTYITTPATAVRADFSLVTTGTWTAGTIDVDQLEVRKVIGTTLIQDAAITTAKINDLAVNDAKIGSLSVGKLTAGTMSADVVVSGRFATALTGLRVEVNSLGFQKYDASGNLLVSITGTEALLTGIFKTALSGRRIEIGSAAAVGEIDFLAPDTTKTFIRAWTESSGIEAIQFGVAPTGGSVTSPNSLWNRINYNNDAAGGGGVGYANYRANKHEFIYGKTSGFFHILESADNIGGSNFDRFYVDKTHALFHTNSFEVWEDDGTKRLGIDSGNLTYWDSAGHARLFIDSSNTTIYSASGIGRVQVDSVGMTMWDSSSRSRISFGGGPTSFGFGNGQSFAEFWAAPVTTGTTFLKLATPTQSGGGVYAVTLLGNMDSPGVNLRVEARDSNASSYIPVYASAFTPVSDRSTKADIVDFAGDDSLQVLRALRPRRFRRKKGRDDGEIKAAEPQLETGFVTDEMPPAVVVGDPASGTTGIDLMGLITRLVVAAQKFDDRLGRLEKAGNP